MKNKKIYIRLLSTVVIIGVMCALFMITIAKEGQDTAASINEVLAMKRIFYLHRELHM